METTAVSTGLPLAFALVDIDHFKTVNDTYGHQVGDVVLQTIGKMMVTHPAPLGMVGRYGGEEFALIAPETSSHQVVQALQELLTDVERHSILAGGQRIQVTLSAGIAYRHPGEDLEQVYSDADTALYLAKRSGRNRIEIAAWSPNAGTDNGQVSAA
jgi:diguanylate cyclase (GGDEF)-like protein